MGKRGKRHLIAIACDDRRRRAWLRRLFHLPLCGDSTTAVEAAPGLFKALKQILPRQPVLLQYFTENRYQPIALIIRTDGNTQEIVDTLAGKPSYQNVPAPQLCRQFRA